ncbi:unnamed protein product, partial [Mesorhabditis spiculigera]
MKLPSWRRVLVSLALGYAALNLLSLFYNLYTIPDARRVFTKKDLFEGPLLRKYNIPEGKGVKTVFGVYVVNAQAAFDQPLGKPILKPFNASSPLPKFSGDFLKNLVSTARKVAEKTGGFPYVTLINSAYRDLTLNWMCNVAGMNKTLDRTIIISTSALTCKKIKHDWKQVSCLHLKLGDEYEGAFEWGLQQYINLLTIRAQILRRLVQDGITFLLFETDAVWFKDPAQFFASQNSIEDADIIVPTKGYTHRGETYAFDPMLVYPTSGSQALFKEMERRLVANRKLYDQYLLEEMCKSQFNGVICRQFAWEEVADGKWFKMSTNERLRYNPYIVNNNYYMARQAINGLWFLTKMKNCVSLKVNKALKIYASPQSAPDTFRYAPLNDATPRAHHFGCLADEKATIQNMTKILRAILISRCCATKLCRTPSTPLALLANTTPSTSFTSVRGLRTKGHENKGQHAEKEEQHQESSNEQKDSDDKKMPPPPSPEMIKRLRIYLMSMLAISLTGTIYLVTRKVRQEAEKNPEVTRDAINDPGTSLEEFVLKYLKRGEVRKIVYLPAEQKAVAVLHDGAVVDGRLVGKQTVTINANQTPAEFWAEIRRVEASMGIPLQQGVDLQLQQTFSTGQVLQLIAGLLIIIFLGTQYGRLIARKVAEKNKKA